MNAQFPPSSPPGASPPSSSGASPPSSPGERLISVPVALAEDHRRIRPGAVDVMRVGSGVAGHVELGLRTLCMRTTSHTMGLREDSSLVDRGRDVRFEICEHAAIELTQEQAAQLLEDLRRVLGPERAAQVPEAVERRPSQPPPARAPHAVGRAVVPEPEPMEASAARREPATPAAAAPLGPPGDSASVPLGLPPDASATVPLGPPPGASATAPLGPPPGASAAAPLTPPPEASPTGLEPPPSAAADDRVVPPTASPQTPAPISLEAPDAPRFAHLPLSPRFGQAAPTAPVSAEPPAAAAQLMPAKGSGWNTAPFPELELIREAQGRPSGRRAGLLAAIAVPVIGVPLASAALLGLWMAAREAPPAARTADAPRGAAPEANTSPEPADPLLAAALPTPAEGPGAEAAPAAAAREPSSPGAGHALPPAGMVAAVAPAAAAAPDSTATAPPAWLPAAPDDAAPPSPGVLLAAAPRPDPAAAEEAVAPGLAASQRRDPPPAATSPEPRAATQPPALASRPSRAAEEAAFAPTQAAALDVARPMPDAAPAQAEAPPAHPAAVGTTPEPPAREPAAPGILAAAALPAGPAEAPAPGLLVRARADAWVQVRDARGGTLIARVLRAGEEWAPPPVAGLRLTTGNAGGTELVVNGTALPPLGPVGVVRRDVPLDPSRL